MNKAIISGPSRRQTTPREFTLTSFSWSEKSMEAEISMLTDHSKSSSMTHVKTDVELILLATELESINAYRTKLSAQAKTKHNCAYANANNSSK